MRARTARAATAGAGVVVLLTTGLAAAVAPSAPVRPQVSLPPLAVSLTVAAPPDLRPGQPVPVSGVLRSRDRSTGALGAGLPGALTLRVRDADGGFDRVVARLSTDPQGRFSAVVPAEATAGATPTALTGWRQVLAVEATDVRAAGATVAEAGQAPLTVTAAPSGLQLEDSFVSATGWVKPGDEYAYRVFLRNYSSAPVSDVTVTVPTVDGMLIRAVTPVEGGGTAALSGGTATWTVPSVPAGSVDSPAVATLLVEARAKTLAELDTVVWRNLSTTATATYAGSALTSTSHGPKVIPPDSRFDTARYGNRPFPVVPVDYADYKHGAGRASGASASSKLASVLNDPANPGSLFNLMQENSLGQLFVQADVASAGIATKPYDPAKDGPLTFAAVSPTALNTCDPTGLARAQANPTTGQPLATYTSRINDGWYQLPYGRSYYGQDANGSALVGAVGGVGALQNIDAGCGPTAKMAYDAAAVADPEIDYNDFDTNKDGVVDFFEVIFQGLGGNGASQGLGCDQTTASDPDKCPTGEGSAPYDNVWPHSSSLENTYVDARTGLKGYVSKDQLKDYDGKGFWYTDASRTRMTKTDMGDDLKVFVRVGPYNVNPETSISKASVVGHEYAHSLGSPDYYSSGSRATYGDWSLSATDKMQNESGFETQELGWIVPEPLPAGTSTLSNFTDTKTNTRTIRWQTPAGKPYTLTGPGVNNAQAYTVKLPGKTIIDPRKVAAGASPSKLWWSTSGNDFGCTPEAGRNLDIDLSALKDVPAGTPVTLTFNSAFEIEWDYDYGFVMVGTPDSSGTVSTYTSLPSQNGFTSTVNPNANGCQAKYGNGITGSSQSYKDGTQQVDRVLGNYPDFTFAPDSYDLSSLAGKGGVVRFSYATDPGLAKTGWFIDDVKVTAGGKTIYASNFEQGAREPGVVNGGCTDSGLQTAGQCTAGWQYVDASSPNPADRGYYLTMRDRSGFDLDSRGQNDRAPIGFAPGLLLEYTDESRGYGNVGAGDPPPQSPLDAKPEPGNDSPNLDDAAFNTGEKFSDSGWVDNYTDPSSASGNWEFNNGCLSFEVTSMRGDADPTAYDSSGAVTGVQSGASGASDLVGTVQTTTTGKCAAFDYGYGVANTAPKAVPQAKPTTASVNQAITFDGSQSYDDRTPASGLRYAWDFGDGHTATGATVQHAYTEAGTRAATLTVTDPDGAIGRGTVTVTVTVTVTAPGQAAGGTAGGGSGRTGGGGTGGGSGTGGGTGSGGGSSTRAAPVSRVSATTGAAGGATLARTGGREMLALAGLALLGAASVGYRLRRP